MITTVRKAWFIEQQIKCEANGMLARQFMDPRPSAAAAIDHVRDPSVAYSSGKTTADHEAFSSFAPSNLNIEVMSTERDQYQRRLQTNINSAEEALDRSSQCLGSPNYTSKSSDPNLFDDDNDEPKRSTDQEQVPVADQIPFRKARVSVRARSEAPMVCTLNHLYSTKYIHAYMRVLHMNSIILLLNLCYMQMLIMLQYCEFRPHQWYIFTV